MLGRRGAARALRTTDPLRGTAGGRGLRPLASTARGFFVLPVGYYFSLRHRSISRSAIFLSRVGRDRPSACAARALTPRARFSAASISERSSASTLLASVVPAAVAGSDRKSVV